MWFVFYVGLGGFRYIFVVIMLFDCQLLQIAFIKQPNAFAKHRCAADVYSIIKRASICTVEKILFFFLCFYCIKNNIEYFSIEN